MLAYIGVNGAQVRQRAGAVARNDTYNSVVSGQTLTVSDPAKGVIANDTNVYGVQLGARPGLTLNANGTFTYTRTTDELHLLRERYRYSGVCSSGITAMVTLGAAPVRRPALTVSHTYTPTVANSLSVKSPASC